MKKVKIIAEAGINHNGKLKNALKLVDIASKAGADYIKFQTYVSEDLVTKSSKKAKYQILKTKKESQYKMLKKYELSHSDHFKIISYCKKKNIKFLSSAFDHKSLIFLKKLNLDYFKIPSGEINNLPYLKILAKFNKKVILSTGASSLNEINNAVRILNKHGTPKKKITILQCNSSYPSPFEDINLLAIPSLKKKLKLEIGFSDHTLGTEAPIAAVALGAVIIEKHITLDKNLKGPDHKSSISPNELTYMVKSIRNIEKALGLKKKIISKSEKINQKYIRKSIVAKKDIKIGDKFSFDNICVKRPGFGKSPMLIEKIIGKKSKKNFLKDSLI